MPDLTPEQISAAVTNTYDAYFTLGEGDRKRQFQVKDLPYDDYTQFMKSAKPIIQSVAGCLKVEMKPDGELDLGFDHANFDYDALIEMAEKDLPVLAWLCCKQSEPTITVKQVKELARRPQALIEVVLKYVKHNDLVKEFVSFFPQLMTVLKDLTPPSSMTEETR